MSYRYYLPNRPPTIGTHPQGASEQQAWLPKQAIPADLPGYERQACGYVVYPAPLPLRQVWQYELEPTPTNLPLWLVYRYWLDGNQSPQDAEWLIRDAWDSRPGEVSDPVDLALLEYKAQGGQLPALLAMLSTLAGA